MTAEMTNLQAQLNQQQQLVNQMQQQMSPVSMYQQPMQQPMMPMAQPMMPMQQPMGYPQQQMMPQAMPQVGVQQPLPGMPPQLASMLPPAAQEKLSALQQLAQKQREMSDPEFAKKQQEQNQMAQTQAIDTVVDTKLMPMNQNMELLAQEIQNINTQINQLALSLSQMQDVVVDMQNRLVETDEKKAIVGTKKTTGK